MMKEIVANKALVAFCGLYCGACGQFLRGKCAGCVKNEKATWCSIRKCCSGHSWGSCAECTLFSDVNDCKKFNNMMSKIFAIIFRSNRKACVKKIKAEGRERFAVIMAGMKRHSLPR